MSRLLKSQSVLDSLGQSKILVQTAIPSPANGTDSSNVLDDGARFAEAERLLQRAEEEYQSRIEAAHLQVQAMLNEAVHQIEAEKEVAREAGYLEGLEQGRAEAMRACEAVCQQRLERAQAVIAEANQERRQLLGTMHHSLTRITMDAIRTLLRRELTVQPAGIESIVSELLQYVVEGTRIEVRVHPTDFAQATQAHPKWKAAKFGEWEVAVVPDSTITEGGCEIRSEFGRIDARIETGLALMEETVQDVMERGVESYADSDS